MNRIFYLFLLCLLPITVSAHETAKSGIILDHPWIRATAANAPMTAGYFKITNGGFSDDRLIGVTAGFANSVEIHETIKVGEISKMRAISGGLTLPEEAEIIFKPGGMHLMFRGLQQQMVAGETFQVEMQFEETGSIMVEFLVEKASKRGHDHSENMKLGTGHH